MKQNLKEQVAKLVAQLIHMISIDGVLDLIGLFDRVGCDGFERLFTVPRAVRAKPVHQGFQSRIPFAWQTCHNQGLG